MRIRYHIRFDESIFPFKMMAGDVRPRPSLFLVEDDVLEDLIDDEVDGVVQTVNVDVNNVAGEVEPRRSKRVHKPERCGCCNIASYESEMIENDITCHIASYLFDIIEDDITPRVALNGPHADLWQRAMEEELANLKDVQVWDILERPEKSVISCKWVLKIKRNSNGGIDRLKARLVARGFSQLPNIDFFDTYSFVVKRNSSRNITALGRK